VKIHKVIQGEAEWHLLRIGRVTASELDALVTPLFAIKKGEGPNTYLCKKVAEKFKNRPLEDEEFTSYDTEQGQMLEDEARKLFVFAYKPKGERLIDAGFVEHDDGRFGCSPDALIGETSGLEIKCPKYKTHVKYLLGGELPAEYAAQVHGSIYATGRPSWTFMSYAKGFPPFVLKVERDEKICATIAEALAAFYNRFDAAMQQLREAA
jgi:hypothetical protein